MYFVIRDSMLHVNEFKNTCDITGNTAKNII